MSVKFYLVGGAVRDSLMGLTPKDLDFACEAPSFDALRQDILAKGGEIFQEREQFGTIRARMPIDGKMQAADFVLCRKDGFYSDGRHPDSVSAGTIFDDLARRDFTVNAMAQDVETKEIIDPFDGQSDLARKILLCVFSARHRLREDPLRVFRAIRFAVTKGFHLHFTLVNEIKEGGINFDSVSTERIREELFRACQKDSIQTFRWLFDLGLFKLVQARGIWFKPTTEI
jgi:tRNA nucleotidyltransferase (CCA-adding enzyme)